MEGIIVIIVVAYRIKLFHSSCNSRSFTRIILLLKEFHYSPFLNRIDLDFLIGYVDLDDLIRFNHFGIESNSIQRRSYSEKKKLQKKDRDLHRPAWFFSTSLPQMSSMRPTGVSFCSCTRHFSVDAGPSIAVAVTPAAADGSVWNSIAFSCHDGSEIFVNQRPGFVYLYSQLKGVGRGRTLSI